METRSLAALSDDDLLDGLATLLRQSRRVEVEIVEHIAEVDGRKLYAREACSSMFAYCTGVLHLSEAEAYLRITVARASRKHSVLLSLLADGRLHLTGIALLAPHLTADNRDVLLARGMHKSKREIEELVAAIAPRPDVPERMRRLPQKIAVECPNAVDSRRALDVEAPRSAGTSAIQAIGLTSASQSQLRPDGVGTAPLTTARSSVAPLAPGRYRVQFTASAALRDKLEHLLALMRQEAPDGDLATVTERAVTEKLERIEARRFADTRRPRAGLPPTEEVPRSRYVPAAIRRAVRDRDGDQCGFVGSGGRRCSERHSLEYHHRHPFGMGGGHSPANVGLLCRAHNAWLAEQDYGWGAIERNQRRAPAQATRRPAAEDVASLTALRSG